MVYIFFYRSTITSGDFNYNRLQQMKILVTGGAGFIGSHMSERLLKDGHDLVCVDNFITGRESNISHLEANPKFRLIRHNITQPLQIDGPLDVVLHFASPASPADYLKYPIQTLKVGSLGTLNALGIAKTKQARFLLASTSEVYGDPQVHPQPEGYWGHVNPVGPRGVYDESKRFAEALTMAYHQEHRVNTQIARIFNTYGPRMRMEDGRAIPNFLTQALRGEPLTIFGEGKQTRSFCYVSDLVDGLIGLMKTDCHDPVNVGNPEEYTVLELAKVVLKLTAVAHGTLDYRPLPTDDPRQRRPDISKINRLTGWKPRVSLEEGLVLTIPWFRQAVLEADPSRSREMKAG